MSIDLDFLNPSYKPALLALSAEDVITVCKDVLRELNYKVLVATSHEDFTTRFANVQFQLIILEEDFGNQSPDGNASLRSLQHLPMIQRRHTTIILLGHN